MPYFAGYSCRGGVTDEYVVSDEHRCEPASLTLDILSHHPSALAGRLPNLRLPPTVMTAWQLSRTVRWSQRVAASLSHAHSSWPDVPTEFPHFFFTCSTVVGFFFAPPPD